MTRFHHPTHPARRVGVRRRTPAGAAILLFASLFAAGGLQADPLPKLLSETGLYADPASHRVAADNLVYAPQYPLWSDGARKSRWIYLPAGTTIDASRVDSWVFPIGTKLWKEFAFDRRVETRYMERGADGAWVYGTYVWSADESDATLAPESGIRGAYAVSSELRHDIPGRYDCLSCHQGDPTEVLGFGALQLSPDRDPLAPHADSPPLGAVDLASLASRGLLVNLPAELLRTPPRIAAATPRARAALGYLHANCGGCHNGRGPLANLGMVLAYPLAAAHVTMPPAVATVIGALSEFRGAAPANYRVTAGDAAASVLWRRLSSRNPLLQMPPLGTHEVDAAAVALVTEWIDKDLAVLSTPLTLTAADVPAAPSDKEKTK